ncbi:chromosome partitioning protein ParB [Aureimonas sp. SA4125]|uniref:ParB/RepB/Spo0J family partition protein n=1 Tax=Aureimonas sp. SA4125 TaxID=2826993 RepID=UPI001CC78F0A|nr:ParB/RepB/Spo0J family partition protein [Aureimonas sp. SA4125]BDA86844.1 chromosome partitioning protein ParB [Aureimonas sp. SA4125]
MNEDRSRQRLGRGLASLIGTGGAVQPRHSTAFAPQEEAGERRVPLARLSANPRNPRRHFGDAELAELTQSIRSHGMVQPILVRALGNDRYEIVAGERRWRAAAAAGLAEVPVVVREISDRESLEIAIIENVQRADLSALEEANAYQMLIDEHGYTQSDLGDVLGKSRSHVANTLRLLKLPDAVRGMLDRGELSAGHARTAVSAEDPEAFARQIVERGLSVREAEEMARGPVEAPARPAAPRSPRTVKAPAPPVPAPREKDADTRALERLLSETLGMRVEIRLPEEGGDLRIDYGNLEQLDEICRLLQAKAKRAAEPRVVSF